MCLLEPLTPLPSIYPLPIPPQPFRFLDLPSEIRIKIYILASTAPSVIRLNRHGVHDFFPIDLLLANTQIYHELRPHYFAVNTFAVTLLRRNETWDYIISPSFLDNRRQIRSLQLQILRWGSKDYFLEKLAPALEDMVMNGRLRDLEVRIREIEVEKQHGPNWEALLKLLRDPYLERKVLVAGRLTHPADILPAPPPTMQFLFGGEGR